MGGERVGQRGFAAFDFAKRVKLDAQGARPEPHLIRKRHNRAQGRPGHGQRESLTQPVEVNIMPVIACHHGHAGQPALGSFRSVNNRYTALSREVQGRAHWGIYLKPVFHSLVSMPKLLEDARQNNVSRAKKMANISLSNKS